MPLQARPARGQAAGAGRTHEARRLRDRGFTLCGRRRDDQGPEKIRGTILYLPAKEYDAAATPRSPARPHEVPRTIRIRAKIESFDRERYRIGPKWTAGWLARVQQLAPVVATEGTIEVNLFAMEAGGK